MFDRKKYKEFSQIQLKKRWGVPILMTVFTLVISMLFQVPSLSKGLQIDYSGMSILDALTMYSAATTTGTATLLTWIQSFILLVIDMAVISVYIKMSHSPDPVTFGNFIEGFSTWLKAILIGLWQGLFIVLWTFLLIIPGLIKAYAYSQMVFIACEYPNVSVPKLMKISKEITKGHKWDLFVLDLSFIGWFFVSFITCGLAGLYVTPYYQMTKVNAYHALMKEAIDKGILSPEDVK